MMVMEREIGERENNCGIHQGSYLHGKNEKL
jgi:hypothetical protein